MVRTTSRRSSRWFSNLLLGRGLTTLVCSLLLVSTFASAQGLPLIKLSDLTLEAGENLVVTASGLEPATTYTLTLTNDGSDGVTETLSADEAGGFVYPVRLGTPGRWRLNVQGSDLDAQFEVTVTGQTPTVTTPSETETPELGTPELGTPEPDTPEPGTTEPETLNAQPPAPNVPGIETAPLETAPLAPNVPQGDTDATEGTNENVPTPPESTAPETDAPENTAQETGAPDETVPSDTTPTDTTPTDTTPTEQPSATPETEESAEQEGESPPILNAPSPNPSNPNAPGDEPATSSEPDASGETDAAEDAPPDAVPTEAPAPTVPPDEVVLDAGAVVARGGGDTLWTLDFPADSGETRGLLVRPEAVYVGHGNSLLKLDPLSGAVQNRLALPGQITDVQAAPDGLTVTTETVTLDVSGDDLQTRLPFAPDPGLFGLLRAEAAVADPAARLAQDPTNPWLYLRVGEATNDPGTLAEAVNRATTFYDAAGLSRALVDAGQPDLANRAFDKALQDFAARGYDPRLLRAPTLHEAYNFPLRPLQDALAAGDTARADFWAPWLAYFATPDVPEVNRVLRDYAAALRRDGRTDEAARYRDLGRGRLRTPGTLASAALFLGRNALYSALALLVTALALHLTLAAKYWRAQGVNFERRRILKRSVSPVSRLFIMRFYSLTEKLVLLVLLVGALVFAGLASGYRGGASAASLGSGIFATAEADLGNATTPPTPTGPRSEFVQGYAAQAAGDAARARERYTAAGDYAPALNNLGTLSGDDALYRRAAEAGLPEARYNLGEAAATDFLFHQEYQAGEALAAVPNVQDLRVTRAGDWSGAVAGVFVNPWTGLRAARPAGMDANLWTVLVALFLVAAAITLVWLFIPRLRWVRNAPRGWLYHLLALLVPGSGLADEMWGLLLLFPWALVGLDTLSHLYGWGIGVGLSLDTDLVVLAVLYLVNTISVIVEFWSYRRRMTALKRDNPELALEFGLIRPAKVRRLG